jgi:thiol-disulfide isomerase/thioredoxin
MKAGPYLLLQAVLSSAYLVFRIFFCAAADLATLQTVEFQCFAVVGIVLTIRLIRIDSWIGYSVFALKLVHIVMCAIMFMYHVPFAICFCLSAVLVHFGVEPPFLQVSHRVAKLDTHLLLPYIETVPECYILFYATWDTRSIAVTPVFSAIAERATAKGRLFARFDIGRVREVEEHFGISATNGALNQLPTIIHFKDGKEVKRLNPAIAEGKALNLPTITKWFDLPLPPKSAEDKKTKS